MRGRREAARKARDLTRRKSVFDSGGSGKLADCSIDDPDMRTLRGGRDSAEQREAGPRRRFQHPSMKENTECGKARLHKIGERRNTRHFYGNRRGVSEEFNAENTLWKNFLCATRRRRFAYRTLLMTLFFRYMKEMIELGICISHSPR